MLQQIADAFACLRRTLQQLEESGRWLGLLSRLDRLESKKRKQEKKFWSNPEMVALYEAISVFCRQHAALLKQSLEGERQSIDALLSGVGAMHESMLQQAEMDLTAKRKKFFTELLAYMDPEMNQGLLVVHGVEPFLSYWADRYLGFLKPICDDVQELYLYRRKREEKPPLSDLVSSIQHDDVNERYQMYSKMHQKLGAPDALGFLVKSPCINHFLNNEEGVVSSVVEGDKNVKLFIELYSGELSDYHPQEAIYRKKFYEQKKSLRRMRDQQLEMLDRSGAVTAIYSWESYLQLRCEQGEASVIDVLLPGEQE
jgi:hypothetical protein